MKTFIPTVFFFFVSLTLFAGNTPDSTEKNCRTEVTDFPSEMSIAERVQWDLLRGIWTEYVEDSGNERIYLFNSFGVTDIIETSVQGQSTYKSLLWRIEEYDGRAFLAIHGKSNHKEVLYRVDVNCQGLSLVNVVSNERIELDHEPKRPDAKINLKKADLIGPWECVSYPFTPSQQATIFGTSATMQDAFMTLQFRPDGSYTKKMGNGKKQFVEEGYFEVSKDGNFIIFFSKKDKMENVIDTTVARIKFMAVGELVLEITDYPVNAEQHFTPQLKTVTLIN